MRGFGSVLAAFVLALPIAARADLAANPEQNPTPVPLKVVPFDGVWEGTIFFDKEAFLAPTSTPAEGAPMRIEIDGAVVRVFVQEVGSSNFEESKPGLFHIAPVASNAIVFATQDESVSSGWVESWVFVLTQKDTRTLVVEYSRLVNNVDLPRSDPHSTFATRGYGELKLVSEVPAK